MEQLLSILFVVSLYALYYFIFKLLGTCVPYRIVYKPVSDDPCSWVLQKHMWLWCYEDVFRCSSIHTAGTELKRLCE